MTKIAMCSIVAISSALAAISTGVNRTYSNSIINGDLLGAAHVTCTTPRSEDVSNTIEIKNKELTNRFEFILELKTILLLKLL